MECGGLKMRTTVKRGLEPPHPGGILAVRIGSRSHSAANAVVCLDSYHSSHISRALLRYAGNQGNGLSEDPETR